MKKIALVALLLSAFSMGLFARGKQPIAFDKLPQVVQEEIQKNFDPSEVQLITSKKTAPRRFDYAFNMADGTKIMYTNKAQLLKVENIKGINVVFLPEKVLTYIQETFPNANVTEYKIEYGVHKVELNNEIELLFTKKGKFIRIDE